MIKYDRFWVTMKERGITQYDLYEHYQITRSLLDRLRKNKNVEIYTIDRLCSIPQKKGAEAPFFIYSYL